MTALLGKVCLLAGCAALGVLRGCRLGQRAACLEEFRRVLEGLSRELSFSLRPVADLLAGAAEGSRGNLAAFFQTCRRRFDAGGQESWAESWWAALDQTPLPLEEEDRRLLQEAGDVLGRYDGESQRQALTALVQRLADQAQKARATAQRLFRVYVALGVAGGLFCVIML